MEKLQPKKLNEKMIANVNLIFFNTIKDIQLKMGVLPDKLTIFYKAGKTFAIIGTDIFHRMSLIFNYKKKKLFFIMQ